MIKEEDFNKLGRKGNNSLKLKIKEIGMVEVYTLENIKEIVQNKNIPLDIRFYLLTNSEITPIDSFYFHLDGIDWDRMSLYDDFYCDKYATMLASDMIDIIEDKKSESSRKIWLDIDVNNIKEQFCQKFIKGFINAW